MHDTEHLLVAVNFGAEPVTIPVTILPSSPIVLLSTHLDRDGAIEPPIVLRPNEGIIIASP